MPCTTILVGKNATNDDGGFESIEFDKMNDIRADEKSSRVFYSIIMKNTI